MPVPAAHIRDVFDAYLAAHPDQCDYLKPASELLAAEADATARDNPVGHVTASAIVENSGRLVAIGHRKNGGLRLQPGGHVEKATDHTLYGVSLRELAEEAGVRDVRPVSTEPIHVAVHHVPDYAGEPAHIHVDFRFGFTTIVEQLRHDAVETDGAAWIAPDDIENASFRAGADALFLTLERRSATSGPEMDPAYRGREIPMGVYLILRDGRDRLLVQLRSDKVAVSPDMWALPCGSREFGESARDAIVREAYEELGITIHDPQFAAIGDVVNSYGPTTAMYFTAETWDGEVTNREPELCRELAWIERYAPLPVPFVEHVETVLSATAGQVRPYTAIGWPHAQATASVRAAR